MSISLESRDFLNSILHGLSGGFAADISTLLFYPLEIIKFFLLQGQELKLLGKKRKINRNNKCITLFSKILFLYTKVKGY